MNYYTFAFAALGQGLPGKHPIKELYGRMEIAWEYFPRKTMLPAKNLRDSICPWIGVPKTASFRDAIEDVLPTLPEQKEIRSLAVALLAEKAKTLKPQKCSNSYWIRFCDILKKEPNWDYSGAEQSRRIEASGWTAALWLEQPVEGMDGLARTLKLSSLVKCDPGANNIDEEEARGLLADAFKRLAGIANGTVKDTKPAKRTNSWLRINNTLVENFLRDNQNAVAAVSSEQLIDEKARGGGIDINKTHSVALFKVFPCQFSLEYIRAAVPKPKEKRKRRPKDSREYGRFWKLEFVQLVTIRSGLLEPEVNRFLKAFTALKNWQTASGRPCWPDLDKCAFEEYPCG